MAKKKEEPEQQFTVSPDYSAQRKWRNGLITFAVIILIILVTGFITARTEGFRSWLEGELERMTGMVLDVGNTTMVLPYCLVVENVSSADSDEADKGGSFVAKEIRVNLNARFDLHIEINGCTLTMRQQEDGSWSPSFFSGLGEHGEVDMIPLLTEDFRRNIHLEIENADIWWEGSRGEDLGSVDDMSFSIEPLAKRDRTVMYYCAFEAADVIDYDVGRRSNVKRRFIITEDNQMLEIERISAIDGEDDESGGTVEPNEPGTD